MEAKIHYGTALHGFIDMSMQDYNRQNKSKIQRMSNSSLVSNLCRVNDSAIFSEILCAPDCESLPACEWGKEYLVRKMAGVI